MFRKLIFIAVIIFIIVITIIFLPRGASKENAQQPQATTQPQISENQPPKIVSTNPSPLEEAIIASDQQIEIVFNRGLENEGELKLRFEPKVEYKITLSQDRKTATISPQKPFELGIGYTLFILPDTKFQGTGEWKEEKIFHFQTIKYRGV